MTAPDLRSDPVISRVADEMRKLYGARLKGLYLFGSRARGDHRPDSDYDIAVVLDRIDNEWNETLLLADKAFDLLLDTGHFVSLKPMTHARMSEWTGFASNLRRDAVAL
jgi:predicted nucleotidyltransferase